MKISYLCQAVGAVGRILVKCRPDFPLRIEGAKLLASSQSCTFAPEENPALRWNIYSVRVKSYPQKVWNLKENNIFVFIDVYKLM